VGQLYNSTNVSVTSIVTTKGFLSSGNSVTLVLFGDDDDDRFELLHNEVC
jgi:uncharacterized protein YaaQ